ncbi:MAG: glycosyl transferase [Deltaproteobacteria bacterium HGW-Deltaproteobacteria-13]|nr:MAG: glycosyl transferase [Deltaproteobacteria bacterium HGW-Deltaproteobacteria-13]
MKITIVTVCRNSAATIRDTLESIASQSHKNFEHIIIDGGSTDGTLAVIHEWKKHRVHLVSEPDNGIYDAMNKGIRLATGDVIGILNSDDVYYDSHILENVSAVMSNPAIDACYADLIYVDKDNIKNIIRYWKSCAFKKGLFSKGWMPPHPTFFARRRVYENYGLFDLNYALAADVELLARFLERFQIQAVYIPRIFIRMRLGGISNNSVVNIIRQNFWIYKAFKKNNVPLSPVSFLIVKISSRIKQFCARPTI